MSECEVCPDVTDVIVGAKSWAVECEDALEMLGLMPDGCVDSIVTDPPYPAVDRDYGVMSEDEWGELMREAVVQFRRVLSPAGSAAIVLQANSSRVGSLRPWLYEFMAWCCHEWNIVQDFWWWNTSAMPTVHCQRRYGLARPSMKAIIWLGSPDCYRDQREVMLPPSAAMLTEPEDDDRLRRSPSGHGVRRGRIARRVAEAGGVTPFNVLPIPNADSSGSAGAVGHGAGTPAPLCDWWVRYITPPAGLVLDPFCGSGTVPLAAVRTGRRAIGIEKMQKYADAARDRIEGDAPLLNVGGGLHQ